MSEKSGLIKIVISCIQQIERKKLEHTADYLSKKPDQEAINSYLVSYWRDLKDE